jgi:hypothetical protein
MTTGHPTRESLTARLHSRWVGGRDGYRYSVICRGELIVDRSRDPECDAARALKAMGHTGKLTILDGKSGNPRTIIDIQKAAMLRSMETANGPRFRRDQTCAESLQTAGTDDCEAKVA